MSATPAFTVPDDAARRTLQLVASFGGHQGEVNIAVGDVSDVEFTDAAGAKLSGANTAARCLAGSCPQATALLGTTPEQQAKVSQWLTFRRSELTPLIDDKLVKLNDWLLTRTFLAGPTITLADLVVYAAVQPAVCGFPVAQHAHFANLLRWYDHVHHVADKQALFAAATFAKPRLVLPPPPVAVPKAKPAATAPAAPAAAAEQVNGSTPAAQPPADAAAKLSGADKRAAKKATKKAAQGADGDAAAPATPAQSGAAVAATAATAATASSAAPPAGDAPSGPTPDILDLRVGVIVKVGPHPNADALYVEDIDVGEAAPRQVVSGLRKFVSEEAMQGRRVVVVCNLKPAKMRDVMSYGMVLCASDEGHTAVDPITPPEGAAPGERVTFEGFGAEPEAQLHPKKKQFEKLAPDLVTDAAGVCTFKGSVPFMTSSGPVTASMPGAHIK